jgi:hypothetical protein
MNFSYLILSTRNILHILIAFQFLFKFKKVETFIEHLDFFRFNILYVHCLCLLSINIEKYGILISGAAKCNLETLNRILNECMKITIFCNTM